MSAAPEMSIVNGDTCPVRSRIRVGGDLAFLSVRVTPKQTLSIPFSISWSSITNTKATEILHDHIDLIVSGGWQYDISGLFAVRCALGGGVRIYPDLKGWAPVYLQAQADFHVRPFDDFAVTFPIRCTVTDQQTDLALGIGFQYLFDLENEEDESTEETEAAV